MHVATSSPNQSKWYFIEVDVTSTILYLSYEMRYQLSGKGFRFLKVSDFYRPGEPVVKYDIVNGFRAAQGQPESSVRLHRAPA